MNQVIFKINGQDIALFTALSEEQTKLQIEEIFGTEHYKKGKIKKDMVIIDCGANIGLASLYFKDWAKVIYALEPNEEYYKCLVENIKPYSHIKPYNIGLASRDGKDLLFSNEKGDAPESFFGNGNTKQLALFKTLETFMKEENIEHIDLLKMDTEGAEFVIFPSEGFINMADKINYIVGESHYFGIRNMLVVPEFIPLILKESGFTTEFIPITNQYQKFSFESKEYNIERQTLFFARRKDVKD